MRTHALWCLLSIGCAAGSVHQEPRDSSEAASEASPEATSSQQVIAETAAEEPVAPREIPSACAEEKDGVCVPPAEFVERLCRASDPNVALAMFRKGTPWTRAYLRMNAEAWYVGGQRTSPKQLKFGEEVIIVADRSKTNGIQVSGSGSYDVYRWDGTCVSLMSDEIALRPPTTPEVAAIPWKRLNGEVQQKLESDQRIDSRNRERREKCKELDEAGQEKCARASRMLSLLIADYVRSGGDLPAPRQVP